MKHIVETTWKDEDGNLEAACIYDGEDSWECLVSFDIVEEICGKEAADKLEAWRIQRKVTAL